MAEENRLLARLDELCPYVSVQDINYWGSGASYDGFDTADRTPMAWEVLGYDSIEEYEEAVSNMEGCARGC